MDWSSVDGCGSDGYGKSDWPASASDLGFSVSRLHIFASAWPRSLPGTTTGRVEPRRSRGSPAGVGTVEVRLLEVAPVKLCAGEVGPREIELARCFRLFRGGVPA